MRIRVYAPRFADHSRIDDDGFVELSAGASLDDLLKTLKIPFRRGAALLCTVNYARVPRTTILTDGDTVGFFMLVSGG